MSTLIFLLFLLPLTFSEDLKDYCGNSKLKNLLETAPFRKGLEPYTVPYGVDLTNFEPGQTLVIKGSTTKEAKKFTIDLQSKSAKSLGNDIPLHISVRFDEYQIVLNTLENGTWGKEERYASMITKGEPFDIRIRVHDDGFQVMINQWELTYYEDRIPLSSNYKLSIVGDVCLGYVNKVGEYYDVPYERNFTDGFQVEKTLLFSGIVDENAERFHINILKKNGDIALHFNPRFDERVVVLNSLKSKEWGEEKREPIQFSFFLPFKKGTGFDLAIRNKRERFQIFLNGVSFAAFDHRFEKNDDIVGLQVDGDVDLYYIQNP